MYVVCLASHTTTDYVRLTTIILVAPLLNTIISTIVIYHMYHLVVKLQISSIFHTLLFPDISSLTIGSF